MLSTDETYASSPPSKPMTLLTGATSGTLAGGGEADFQLPVPGYNLSAIVTLRYGPPDASGAVGISLIGSQGEIPGVAQCVGQYSHVPADVYVTPSGSSTPVVVLSQATPFCDSPQTAMTTGVTQIGAETYLVKVYNRNIGVPIEYSLSVSGIPLPCQPATPAGGPTPAQAGVLGQPVTAQLGGGLQGQFAYYHFNYAGDGSTVMLVMFYNPVTDNTRRGAFGFNVYLGSNLITQAQTTPSDGQLVAGFNSTTAGDYYVQVFNYSGPALLINYTLSLSGLPCPALITAPTVTPLPAPSAEGATSDTAIPFSGSDSGSLVGSAAGLFVWYKFDYDGQTHPNLTMTFSPSNPIQSAGSGFNVYGPGGMRVQAGQTGQGPGNLGLAIPSGAPPGAYYIQVFNYIPSSTISFTLQRS